jgi:hypothetical protein
LWRRSSCRHIRKVSENLRGIRQKIAPQTPKIKTLMDKNENKKDQPKKKWYTQDEMLRMLGMHANTLYKHRKKRNIGFTKVSGKIFYSEDDYQGFMMRFYNEPSILLLCLLAPLANFPDAFAFIC